MDEQAQQKAPILTALQRYKSMRVVPFDVPGHEGKGKSGADGVFGRAVSDRRRQLHEAAG